MQQQENLQVTLHDILSLVSRLYARPSIVQFARSANSSYIFDRDSSYLAGD